MGSNPDCGHLFSVASANLKKNIHVYKMGTIFWVSWGCSVLLDIHVMFGSFREISMMKILKFL
jgi:hypothetical protein